MSAVYHISLKQQLKQIHIY